MARRQTFDLFVDKTLQWSHLLSWNRAFKAFWREESNNRALFAKLLRHRKLCTTFNILEHLISENLLLWSRVSHAYVTQRVSSHSDEGTSSFTELCTFENHALWCTVRCILRGCVVKLNGFAVSTNRCNLTVLIVYFCNASVVISDHP